MQRYYSENNTFTGAAIGGTGFPATATTPQGYYTLSISVPTANTYTLTATRAGAQTADTRCGDLTLTSASVRGRTGTEPDVSRCW